MQLKRLPFIPNSQLLPFQAFDDLVVNYSQNFDFNSKDLIIVIDDHFGAISCNISDQNPDNQIFCLNDSKSSQSAIKKNMHANELKLPQFFHSWDKMNAQIDSGTYQKIFVFMPWAKTLHHWKYHIQKLSSLGKSHKNGTLHFVSGGMIKYYTHQYRDIVQAAFGNSDLSRITKKARLLTANWNSTSIETIDEIKSQFNEGKIDHASQILIKCLALPEIHQIVTELRDTQTVLDLGAGSGPLADAILSHTAAKFHLTDDSFNSIEIMDKKYATEVSSGKLKIYHADTFHHDHLKEKKFSLIISNPPYHQYFTLVPELLYLFIHEAIDHLEANGTFIWVTSTQFSPPRKMVGKYLEELGSFDGHTVWKYRKTLWG